MNLTIAIPTYHNTKEQLKRCFSSIAGMDSNILVCVDDDSAEYFKLVQQCAYESKINPVIIQQKNSGLFSARRTLANNTETAWMMFIDADDYFTPAFVDFVNSFNPNAKWDVYTTGCNVIGETNNFKHAKDETVLSKVESGKNSLMWGKFIKTKILKETYSLLPSYPCGLFYGEEIPQTYAFKFFKIKNLEVKSINYTDEGSTSLKVITSIEKWKKLLSIVYLTDFYGLDYIKAVMTERLKTVDASIGKEAISLLRRAMNKAELAEKIILDNQNKGISVQESALNLFGENDPLRFYEVLT